MMTLQSNRMPFSMTVREGIESVLFLTSVSASTGAASIPIPGIVGVFLGVLTGMALFYRRVPQTLSSLFLNLCPVAKTAPASATVARYCSLSEADARYPSCTGLLQGCTKVLKRLNEARATEL